MYLTPTEPNFKSDLNLPPEVIVEWIRKSTMFSYPCICFFWSLLTYKWQNSRTIENYLFIFWWAANQEKNSMGKARMPKTY